MPVRFVATIAALLLANGLSGAENPVAPQFERLMGKPRQVATVLINLPWKAKRPDQLPGLKATPAGPQLRIGAVERKIDGYSSRRHWQSDDGNVWVDLIPFGNAMAGAGAIQRFHQPHSGYWGPNPIVLFTGSGDASKEAIAAALVGQDGSLLSIGASLGFGVHWDRPLPESDRKAFDAALTRFESTLNAVARVFIDPAYLADGPDIRVKPETLPALRMAGFARLWTYVKYNFVYLNKRPEVNWDAVLDSYMPRIAGAQDDVEYGKVLEEAVALLKDGHTGVYPNSVEPHDAPPVLLEPIGGKPVATIVGAVPELAAITPGMELTHIDGAPVSTIIERDIDPYLFSSTIQDRQLREMRELLQGPPGSKVRTRWVAADGNVVEATLTRDGNSHRDALKIPVHRRLEYKKLPGDIAQIGLNDFSDPANDESFEKQFDELRQAKAWIIDLRYNGGGSSDVGYRIISHFIDTPVKGSTWRTRQYNPAFEAWNRPQAWYEGVPDTIEPAAGPRYAGPVFVLTSPSTCSAAEDFLIPLKMSKRVTIVGEPSCGSSGQPLAFTIYGATGRVCTKWDRLPDGTEFVGIGILPDVKAARTKQDVAAGRDAVLETAIRLASAAAH